jgi:hypothetical protein
VLLPDATVLVVGGSTTHPEDWSGYFFDGVMLPEVFDPALGGHIERCEDCAHERVAYNSCLMGRSSNGGLACWCWCFFCELQRSFSP